LIRRVVSERQGLERLAAALAALEAEPTSWFAPSREAFLQRLGSVGEDLRGSMNATNFLAVELQNERLHHDQERSRQALMTGL
jgi:hypothetical protein